MKMTTPNEHQLYKIPQVIFLTKKGFTFLYEDGKTPW